jgi:hypothetical protein
MTEQAATDAAREVIATMASDETEFICDYWQGGACVLTRSLPDQKNCYCWAKAEAAVNAADSVRSNAPAPQLGAPAVHPNSAGQG